MKKNPRYNAPRTVAAEKMKKTVKRSICLNRGQSQRKVVSDSKRKKVSATDS